MQNMRNNGYESGAPALPQIPELLKDGNLNPEIFKEELLLNTAKALEEVSKSQMRKVFDEIKSFKFVLETGESWDKVYPLILMQKAKISYLCKRKSEDCKRDAEYYKNLKKLIFNLIDMCNSREAYFAYATFMEALYGFYYEIAKVK